MKHLIAIIIFLVAPVASLANPPLMSQLATGIIEDIDTSYTTWQECMNLDYTYDEGKDEIIPETIRVRGFIDEEPCMRVAWYMDINYRNGDHENYPADVATAMREWHEFIEDDPALRNRVDQFGEQLESSTMDHVAYIDILRGLRESVMAQEEEYNPHQFAGVTHAPQRGFCFTSDNLEIPAMVESEAHCRSEGLYWFDGTLDEREAHLGH